VAQQIIRGVIHEGGHGHLTQVITRGQVVPVQLHVLVRTVAVRRKSSALDDLDEVFHLLGSHSGRIVTQDYGEHFLKCNLIVSLSYVKWLVLPYPIELVPVATHDTKHSLDAQALRLLGHAAQEAELPVEHLPDRAAYQALKYINGVSACNIKVLNYI